MSALEGPLVFVDIETNGLNHLRGRVIEVAAIRVEGGRIVREFNQLIDPGTELPQFITQLTGITDQALRGAASFHQIARELHDILAGAIFVAHNVRFDYSFLKQEFKRIGLTFQPKQLCTVKLSRTLYPDQKSHKLQSLIERHGFSFNARHRAYDDAHVLWQFVQKVQTTFTPEIITAAVAKQIAQPSIPKGIDPRIVKDLPGGPGVYIFEGEHGNVLYVGKSINIKKRVLSHFSHDHADRKEFNISQGVHHITTHTTPGELSALLLESKLVKELQPFYNRRLRLMRRLVLGIVNTDDAGYNRVQLEDVTTIDPDKLAGIIAVYQNRLKARESLNDIVRTYQLCPKLMGLEKSSGGCFLSQLGKCRGACRRSETPDTYNARMSTAFARSKIERWPYKSPIAVQETTESDRLTAGGIIVDNWCVVGEFSQEPYCEPVIRTFNKTFDLDTYNILRSFFTHKISQLIVRPLTGDIRHSL